jgi:hypothetical protein
VVSRVQVPVSPLNTCKLGIFGSVPLEDKTSQEISADLSCW